jgi:RNA polymerase sigma-70 factor (ECF subfamily)
MAVDDRELILAVKAGNRAAFSQLVVKYQRRVYALAISMVGDHSEADDVGQETFLRAFRSLGGFGGDSDFFTWLYRIAMNVCLDHLRKRRPHISLDEYPLPADLEASTEGDPARLAEVRLAFSRLREAMANLPDGIRAAVTLVMVEGLPAKAAAQILGCQEGTVFWRVHEGRRRLAEALGELSDFALKPATRSEKAHGRGAV